MSGTCYKDSPYFLTDKTITLLVAWKGFEITFQDNTCKKRNEKGKSLNEIVLPKGVFHTVSEQLISLETEQSCQS